MQVILKKDSYKLEQKEHIFSSNRTIVIATNK